MDKKNKLFDVLGNKRNLVIISFILIAVMFLSAYFGHIVATDNGKVKLSEVSFYGSKDNVVNALLFVPKSATSENPAPGVILAYGGAGLKDFMVNTAIELARRGIVAMPVDTAGNGYTEGTTSNVGIDAITYLRNLTYIDKDNIGLGAQSMGVNFILDIANAEPDWYRSMVFIGTAPRPATPELVEKLHNFAILTGWAESSGPDYLPALGNNYDDPKWINLISGSGHEGTIEEGVVYGNISEGTGRVLYNPKVSHAGHTEKNASIKLTVQWMTRTLGVDSSLSPDDTSMMAWKQFWMSVCFVAMIAFILVAGKGIVESDYFAGATSPVPEYKGFTGSGFWIGAIITTLLGPILYYWAFMKAHSLTVESFNSRLPVHFGNYYLGWFIVLAIITAILMVLNYFILRKKGFKFENIGLSSSFKGMIRTMVGALFIFIVIYTASDIIYGFFKLPVTFSGLMIPIVFRSLNSLRANYMLSYFVLYLPYYLATFALLAGYLRPKGGKMSMGMEMLVNWLILSVGSIILILLYWMPMHAGVGPTQLMTAYSHLGHPTGLLFGIAMIYLVPVPIVCAIGAAFHTYFFRKTGKVWLAAIIMALLFAWMQVSTINFVGAIY